MVPHTLLLQKLKALGSSVPVPKWLASYLSDGRQYVNDVIVPFVYEARNLEVIITSTLSWNSQVINICRSVHAVLKELQVNKKALNVGFRSQLVSSFILPHFHYCPTIRNDLTDEPNTKLIKLNSCIRFILDLKLDKHITSY